MNPKENQSSRLVKMMGQPSWRLKSDKVEAFLTELGGQLGPVTFQLPGKRVQPYSIAPWAEEKEAADLIPLLRALRGDFFCLPFGGNSTPYCGEQHPPHGETANATWRLESVVRQNERICLHASLKTKIRAGRVDKRVYLVPGQTVLYLRHTISGMTGPMDLGHHAMLRFPDTPGSGILSTSAIEFGQVFPLPFENPADKGYNCLKAGAEFKSLSEVPLAVGGTTDLTSYPARRGFEDLVIVVDNPSQPFAWKAVTFPKERYVWFALKDQRLLRHTVFWISNGGRHYAPWSGRHVNVLGIEDTTSFFHVGLAESAKANALTKKGCMTCLKLDARRPTEIPYIMGLAAIPAGFDRVGGIVPNADGNQVTLEAANGKKTTVDVCLNFLREYSAW